jgi:hypothetical protein
VGNHSGVRIPPLPQLRGLVGHALDDPNRFRFDGEGYHLRPAAEMRDAATVFPTARGLEGLVRNAGVHACAVIMSAEPLIDTIPLWRRDDGAIITGWDYRSCEAIGLHVRLECAAGPHTSRSTAIPFTSRPRFTIADHPGTARDRGTGEGERREQAVRRRVAEGFGE